MKVHSFMSDISICTHAFLIIWFLYCVAIELMRSRIILLSITLVKTELLLRHFGENMIGTNLDKNRWKLHFYRMELLTPSQLSTRNTLLCKLEIKAFIFNTGNNLLSQSKLNSKEYYKTNINFPKITKFMTLSWP